MPVIGDQVTENLQRPCRTLSVKGIKPSPYAEHVEARTTKIKRAERDANSEDQEWIGYGSGHRKSPIARGPRGNKGKGSDVSGKMERRYKRWHLWKEKRKETR